MEPPAGSRPAGRRREWPPSVDIVTAAGYTGYTRAGQEETRKTMQMFTTHLPDAKLLVLAKVALTPGGVGRWGNALQEAGIDPADLTWLGENGYVESTRRRAAGGDVLMVTITDKGVRDLRLRFVG